MCVVGHETPRDALLGLGRDQLQEQRHPRHGHESFDTDVCFEIYLPLFAAPISRFPFGAGPVAVVSGAKRFAVVGVLLVDAHLGIAERHANKLCAFLDHHVKLFRCPCGVAHYVSDPRHGFRLAQRQPYTIWRISKLATLPFVHTGKNSRLLPPLARCCEYC